MTVTWDTVCIGLVKPAVSFIADPGVPPDCCDKTKNHVVANNAVYAKLTIVSMRKNQEKVMTSRAEDGPALMCRRLYPKAAAARIE